MCRVERSWLELLTPSLQNLLPAFAGAGDHLQRPPQASVPRVVVNSRTPRFVLESLNDLSHLPANLRALDD